MANVVPAAVPPGTVATPAGEDAVLVLDSRRRIQSATTAAGALLGIRPAELAGASFDDIARGGLEGLVVRETPLHRKGARVAAWVVSLSVAEAERNEHDDLVAPWQNSAELAIARTAEGRVLAANEAFARKFGVPRRAWPGQDASNLLHPEDLQNWRVSLARIALTPYRGSHEHRWQTAQGWRWLSWEDTAIRDADGLIVAFRSIGRDVTKRRLAEEHFHKLATAVEQSPFSIVMTTPDGRVQYVNPRYTQSTGYTLEEIFERQIPVLRHGHPTEESFVQFQETVAAGRRWSGELGVRCKDGRMLWEFVQVSPIRNHADEVTHLLCVREDITERKNLEDQLRQAQKMESLGTLAGGIAHDFNNILAIINGFAEIGLSRTAAEDPQFRNLREIHGAAQRAIGLVRQILTFSRKTETTFRAVQVNQLVRDLGRMCSETFQRTIAFQFEIDDKLPEFYADPNQLQQVIMNLCVNARDAMSAGGTITLATSRVPGAELAKLGGDASREYVCIRVTDTGCGMPPEVRARIFEPFFTTKQNSGGTGLGLAVVYGIILNHRGLLDVQSEVGVGSSFLVHLPLEEAEPGKPVAASVPRVRAPRFVQGTETILLVEDETSLRELLGSVMQPAGYRVLFARDGQEAIRILDTHEGRIDAMLLDLNLPHVHGIEVLRHCRGVRPQTGALLVSGNLTTEARRELADLAPFDFVPKPYHLEELGQRLRAVLDASAKGNLDPGTI
ncbi:PAS domain S-box protein [Nibricoccus sp. IMCC34717]|uniref:PAS domain S-box protein n=1 Tax=Nibricoccus sp. IMCC34717 TaxID=3034021 RepID=UPI00384D0490